MFNGLIDSTQGQLQRGSSSRSLGGSTRRRYTEQDILLLFIMLNLVTSSYLVNYVQYDDFGIC
jgi:hypothetical protein